jgi:hypothetical protein
MKPGNATYRLPVLGAKGQALAGLKGYITNLAIYADGTPSPPTS